MEKTLFQKIIDRELPAHIVYEDEHVIAILDAKPVNIGHTLVIPKKPWVNIFDVPVEDFGYAMQIAKRIAESLKNNLPCDGINIVMNNDSAAGQLIFHAHIHVIPRYEGDGFETWHGKRLYNEGEKDEVLEKIKI